jgi:hypothetical protein
LDCRSRGSAARSWAHFFGLDARDPITIGVAAIVMVVVAVGAGPAGPACGRSRGACRRCDSNSPNGRVAGPAWPRIIPRGRA